MTVNNVRQRCTGLSLYRGRGGPKWGKSETIEHQFLVHFLAEPKFTRKLLRSRFVPLQAILTPFGAQLPDVSQICSCVRMCAEFLQVCSRRDTRLNLVQNLECVFLSNVCFSNKAFFFNFLFSSFFCLIINFWYKCCILVKPNTKHFYSKLR